MNKTNFPGNGLVTLDFLFFFRLWQLKVSLQLGSFGTFFRVYGWRAV